MATYNNNKDTAGHGRSFAHAYFMNEYIDFSTTTNATNDVFEVINVPAESVVLAAGIDVITVDSAGNSGTLALGDGSVTYVAAAVPTSTGYMTSSDAVAEMFVPYAAANTLDVTVGTGAVNAVVRVWAIIVDASFVGADQSITFTAA